MSDSLHFGASVGVACLLCLPACHRRDRSETTPEASDTTTSSAASPRPAVVGDTSSGSVFVTSDGRYRVRAPGWKTDKSSDERNVLRIVRGSSEALNLYEEKKIDLTATNLDEYFANELAEKKRAHHVPRGSPQPSSIGGHAARHVETDHVKEGRNWRELFTVIEFDQEYLQVSVLVKPSRYDREALQAIVETIALAGAGASPAKQAHDPSEGTAAPSAPQGLPDTGPVFATSDRRYRLRAPGWETEKSYDDRNVLRIVRGGTEAVNLYEEKKVDVTAANIDEFFTHELAAKKKANHVSKGSIQPLTIGGHAARSVETDLGKEGRVWRELYTVIDFGQEYLEVSALVKPSKYDREALQAIVGTIELQGKDASPAKQP